ncbi:MAG: APC family permease [Gemmatimonadaceae bacterium]|nr:APC family permease [Gemmatimonadaceae bacterium]
MSSDRSLRRALGTVSLAAVMFFNVSGGAFTMEGLVASVGPGMSLLLLVLVPVLWSIPETLLVAELASMLPEEGGYYRWVHRAFGPFWAFQNGWITWCYSLVDMAIYPVLFNQYLAFFFPGLAASTQWMISLVMIWGATFINLRGALRVGQVSVFAAVLVLGTFLAITISALPHMTHVPWAPFTRSGETPWTAMGVGLSTVLWNYIGWDNASTVGEEIREASSTYPRALAITLMVVTCAYVLPLSATLAATDWTTWRDGGWPAIARASGGAAGPLLAMLVAAAGLVSALALFNALLMAYSRIPLAMARDGLLPAGIAALDKRANPSRAVLVSAVCYSIFALLPFGQLVVADVLLYSLALALEYGALIRLRIRQPELRGAFRVPVGMTGIWILVAIPSVILLITVGLSFADGEYGMPAVLGALGATALGPLFYRLGNVGRVERD